MIQYVGTWVIPLFSDDICCDDLISAVQASSKDNSISCGGIVRGETLKSKHIMFIQSMLL